MTTAHRCPAAAERGRSAAEALAVFEFRVTKYDPAHRDRRGAYTGDEWTAASDIGTEFGGVVLTAAEYQRVEDAYATAAVAYLREAGVGSLSVAGLENHAGMPLPFAEGSAFGLAEVGGVVRQLLRGEFWCRLEGVGAFVHVGYDYYMYVGVPVACPGAEALARGREAEKWGRKNLGGGVLACLIFLPDLSAIPKYASPVWNLSATPFPSFPSVKMAASESRCHSIRHFLPHLAAGTRKSASLISVRFQAGFLGAFVGWLLSG